MIEPYGDGFLLVCPQYKYDFLDPVRAAIRMGRPPVSPFDEPSGDRLDDPISGSIMDVARREAALQEYLHRMPFELDQRPAPSPMDELLPWEPLYNPDFHDDLEDASEPKLDNTNSVEFLIRPKAHEAIYSPSLDWALARAPTFVAFDVTASGRVLRELTLEQTWGANATNAFSLLHALERLPETDFSLLASQATLLHEIKVVSQSELEDPMLAALQRVPIKAATLELIKRHGSDELALAVAVNGYTQAVTARWGVNTTAHMSGDHIESWVRRTSVNEVVAHSMAAMFMAPHLDPLTYALNTQPIRRLLGRLPGDDQFLTRHNEKLVSNLLDWMPPGPSGLTDTDRVRLGQLLPAYPLRPRLDLVRHGLISFETGRRFLEPKLPKEMHQLAGSCNQGRLAAEGIAATAKLIVEYTRAPDADPGITRGATTDLMGQIASLGRYPVGLEDLIRLSVLDAESAKRIDEVAGPFLAVAGRRAPIVSSSEMKRDPFGALDRFASWLSEHNDAIRELEQRATPFSYQRYMVRQPTDDLRVLNHYGALITANDYEELISQARLRGSFPKFNGVSLDTETKGILLGEVAAVASLQLQETHRANFIIGFARAVMSAETLGETEEQLSFMGGAALESVCSSTFLKTADRIELLARDIDQRYAGLGTALRQRILNGPDQTLGPSFGLGLG